MKVAQLPNTIGGMPTRLGGTLVDEKFVESYNRLGLSGLTFECIWSDEPA